MDLLYVAGRLLFGSMFLAMGFGHLRNVGSLAQYAASKHAPAPRLSVVVTGLMLLGGGASVMLGFLMEIGAWLLILFLVPAAFMMHNFWAVQDPAQKQSEMTNFLRNLTLAGAALILFWQSRTFGYGPWTLGQPM